LRPLSAEESDAYTCRDTPGHDFAKTDAGCGRGPFRQLVFIGFRGEFYDGQKKRVKVENCAMV